MKDKRLEIRLSEGDVRTLDKLCTDKGVSRSEFVRTLIHGCTDKFGGSTGSKNTFNIGQACQPVEKLAARSGTNPVSKTDEPSSILGSGAKKNSGIRTSTGLWIDIK